MKLADQFISLTNFKPKITLLLNTHHSQPFILLYLKKLLDFFFHFKINMLWQIN